MIRMCENIIILYRLSGRKTKLIPSSHNVHGCLHVQYTYIYYPIHIIRGAHTIAFNRHFKPSVSLFLTPSVLLIRR